MSQKKKGPPTHEVCTILGLGVAAILIGWPFDGSLVFALKTMLILS